VQLTGYTDDIHVMGRTKRAVSAVHEGLRERKRERVRESACARAKEIGLNIRDEKQKQWYKIGEEEE